MPPSDALFSAHFSGFCYEPPGDEGGPIRRRMMFVPILCVSRSCLILGLPSGVTNSVKGVMSLYCYNYDE